MKVNTIVQYPLKPTDCFKSSTRIIFIYVFLRKKQVSFHSIVLLLPPQLLALRPDIYQRISSSAQSGVRSDVLKTATVVDNYNDTQFF